MNGDVVTRRPFALALTAVVVACAGGDSAPASAQAAEGGTEHILACDLVTKAEVEAILGGAMEEPRDNVSNYGGPTTSVCSFSGIEGGGVTVMAWHPYHGTEPTSAAWAAKLQADRDRDIAEETDPDMKEMNAWLAGVKFQPLDGLGVPAAFEDMTAEAFQGVAVHAVKGGEGGVYVSVRGQDLATTRAVIEKALAKVP